MALEGEGEGEGEEGGVVFGFCCLWGGEGEDGWGGEWVIGDCGMGWRWGDGGEVKGNGLGRTLLVIVLGVVVGVCVGLNPHISHCMCAPARA